jgi:hypothetical protein
MPARRKRARKPMRAAKAAAAKLTSLCLDMEEPLNEALDAAHAIRLIGHGLREFANPAEAGAVAATACSSAKNSKYCGERGTACSRPPRKAASSPD